MKANDLRPMRTRPTVLPTRPAKSLAVPPYMQRYADEHEVWHAPRRAAADQQN